MVKYAEGGQIDGKVIVCRRRSGGWLDIQKEVKEMVRHAEGGQADGLVFRRRTGRWLGM